MCSFVNNLIIFDVEGDFGRVLSRSTNVISSYRNLYESIIVVDDAALIGTTAIIHV